MTKKHFIALADAIRHHNKYGPSMQPFNSWHLETLAKALQSMNPRFNPNRWIGYVKGLCGPNGGPANG